MQNEENLEKENKSLRNANAMLKDKLESLFVENNETLVAKEETIRRMQELLAHSEGNK